MTCDNIRVDNLSLFLEKLVFSNFFKTFTDIDQLCMKLVNLTLFGQLQQMRFVVSIEIDRYGLVSAVSRHETYIKIGICVQLARSFDSSDTNRVVLVLIYYVNLSILRIIACYFVVKLYGFAGFCFDVETEGFGSDSEVKRLRVEY